MEFDYYEKFKITAALEYFIKKLKEENYNPDMVEQYENLLERIELS